MEKLTCVLLSIKPRFVEAMVRNEKHYEFRKKIFDAKKVRQVYIYSTAPVKKITATFMVGGLECASPEELWRKFGTVSGLTRDEFFRYYEGRSKGYAIKIEDFRMYDEPIDPYRDERFVPPQSFQYMVSNESPSK
jgi:predicted transcriptional regulator